MQTPLKKSWFQTRLLLKKKSVGLSFVYAGEADLLNIALFGKTAKEWREKNPDLRGNIRDHATLEYD